MIQEQINALEARQLDLQAIMAKSDAHASKCIKLGLNFSEAYPAELAEYEAAREEYNENESTLAGLYAAREEEQAAAEEATGAGEEAVVGDD